VTGLRLNGGPNSSRGTYNYNSLWKRRRQKGTSEKEGRGYSVRRGGILLDRKKKNVQHLLQHPSFFEGQKDSKRMK